MRVRAFVVQRPSPLSAPAAAAAGDGPPPSPLLLEAVAALDAESRRGEDEESDASAEAFLSRALASAKRAEVIVACCCCCSGRGGGGAAGEENESCGYLVWRRLGPLAAARISALGVRAGCRRKGLATELMRACARAVAEEARRRGRSGSAPVAVSLTLAVARSNLPARALYARLGFVERQEAGEGSTRPAHDKDIEMEATLVL